MNLLLPTPLLADGIGTVFFILFLLFSIISAIKNAITGDKKAQPAPRGRQRGAQQARGGKRARLQDEIEMFLEEVSGEKQQRGPQARGVQREPTPAQPVLFEEVAQQRQQNKPAQKKQHSVSTLAKKRGIRKKQRESRKEQFGSKIRQHAEEHIGRDRIDEHVDEHLTHAVNEAVQEHLGKRFSADEIRLSGREKSEKSSPLAEEIFQLFQTPAGVRQAILLNEVLSRPIALRKGHAKQR